MLDYKVLAGTPVVTANAVGKATGAVASGFGLYKAGQAINRIRGRKSKVPDSKPLTNLQKQKLLKLHKLKTNSRNKFGLRPGEYIDRRTGEIKSRSFRSQALKKAAKSTEYGLRRFGGRRFRFR